MTDSRTPKPDLKASDVLPYTKWQAQDKLSRVSQEWDFKRRDFKVLVQGNTVCSMRAISNEGTESDGNKQTAVYFNRECSMDMWNVQTDPGALSTVMAGFPDLFYQNNRAALSYLTHFSDGLIYCGLFTDLDHPYVFNETSMTWHPVKKWIGLDAKESFAEMDNGIRVDENFCLSRTGINGYFTFHLFHVERDQKGNETIKVDKTYKVNRQYNDATESQMKKLEAGRLVSNFTRYPSIALESSSSDVKKHSLEGSTIAPPGGLRVSSGLSAYAASFTPPKSLGKSDQKPIASALGIKP